MNLCDEDALLLAKFLMDRFHGTIPPEQQLINAIDDFKKEYF